MFHIVVESLDLNKSAGDKPRRMSHLLRRSRSLPLNFELYQSRDSNPIHIRAKKMRKVMRQGRESLTRAMRPPLGNHSTRKRCYEKSTNPRYLTPRHNPEFYSEPWTDVSFPRSGLVDDSSNFEEKNSDDDSTILSVEDDYFLDDSMDLFDSTEDTDEDLVGLSFVSEEE